MVNTCTVTGRADFSDRQAIRRIARDNPDALLVVTGCYAQTDAAGRGARFPAWTWSWATRRSIGWLDAARRSRQAPAPGDPRGRRRAASRGVPVAPLARRSGRSRAFVKIQDGCQHRCAFCIVPAARGGSRSQEPDGGARAGRGAGGRGVPRDHADRRGHRPLRPRPGAAHEPGRAHRPARRRAGSALAAPVVGPARVLERRADRGGHRHARVVPPSAPAASERQRPRAAAHAPSVQSRGCSARSWSGWPGRSPASASAPTSSWAIPARRTTTSRRRCAWSSELPLSYLHVFPYSDRKGTEAAGRGGHVAPPVIRERSARVRALGRARTWRSAAPSSAGGARCSCSQERDRETGFLAGLTSNYVEVLFGGPADLARRFARVRITAAGTDRTFGVLEEAGRVKGKATGRERRTGRGRDHRRQRPLRDGRPRGHPLGEGEDAVRRAVRCLLRGPPRTRRP